MTIKKSHNNFGVTPLLSNHRKWQEIPQSILLNQQETKRDMTAKCFPDTTVIGRDSHQGSQSVGKSVSKSSSESDGRCLHQDRGERKDGKQGLKIVTHQNLTPPISLSLFSNLHTIVCRGEKERGKKCQSENNSIVWKQQEFLYQKNWLSALLWMTLDHRSDKQQESKNKQTI